MAPKKFPDQSFDPVPNDGLSHLGADRDAESRLPFVVGFTKDHEMGGVDPSSPA